MSARTESGDRPVRRSRRTLVVAVVLVALLAAGIGWLATRGGSADGEPTASGAPASSGATDPGTTAAPSTTGSAPAPSSGAAPTDVPERLLTSVAGLAEPLQPVALDQDSPLRDGVTARLTAIDAVTAQGHGIGEFSGPALAVTVELVNGTGAPVPVDTVAVNLYHGAAGVPGAPLQDGATKPFGGELAPGRSVSATYVFAVPADDRQVVTVTVGHTLDSGTAVFSGPVA